MIVTKINRTLTNSVARDFLLLNVTGILVHACMTFYIYGHMKALHVMDLIFTGFCSLISNISKYHKFMSLVEFCFNLVE